MLRLHQIAATYGTLPSDVLGWERGTWESWILVTEVSRVGDEARAAMVSRSGFAVPTVEIR